MADISSNHQHIERWPAITVAAFLLFAATDGAFAWTKATLLDCKAKDYVSLSEEGTMAPDRRVADFWIGATQFIADLETGVLRFKFGSIKHYQIVQEGNASNDTVLVDGYRDSARNDFIRIRNWDRTRGITFMTVTSVAILSGTCVELRPSSP